MILLYLSAIPYLIEVFKYSGFVAKHFIVTSDLLTIIILIYIINKIIQNRLKLQVTGIYILYILISAFYLRYNYLEEINYPNFVYSQYHLNIQAIKNILDLFLKIIVLIEITKRFPKIISYYQVILKYIKDKYINVNIKLKESDKVLFKYKYIKYYKYLYIYSLIIIIITGFNWINNSISLFSSKQNTVLTYIVYFRKDIDKNSYIKNLSLGGFYDPLRKFADKHLYDTLIIPNQNPEYSFEGNMPLIRSITFPMKIARSENINTSNINYYLYTCNWPSYNLGVCNTELLKQYNIGDLYDHNTVIEDISITDNLLFNSKKVAFIKL